MQSLYSTSALAVIAAVFSQPAWASVAQQSQQPSAEAASDSDVRSDEIIVTAQRRDQNIQDVPIAINALSSNQLKDRQIESVADLAASLPGVKFAEFSGAGNVYIRGVGTTLVSGSGESSIAAHVDGIYLAQAQATTMVQDDLGRVEVLRGPQGTLYGRNSTGGVINYISADPSNEFSGSVSALYGNYDRKQIQGNINAPLSDNVRVRLYGKYQDRDGWTLNTITGQKLDGIKQAAGRVSVDANVTPTWTSKLRLTVDHEDITGPVFDAYVPGRVFPGVGFDLDPRKVSSPDIYDSYKEVWVGSFKNEFQLGDVKLTSLSGLVDFTFNADYDGVPGTRPVRINRIQKSRDYSQELNLSGSAGKLDFIAGVYYYQSNKSTVSLTDFSKFVIALPNSVITHSSKQHSYSGFGDMTYRVSETVRLYGGLRYSAEDLEQSLDIVGQCSGANIQKFKSNGITGRAGLQADVSDGVMVYGQYSHGYKPGGFSSSRCNNNYLDESIDAFEAGVKASIANGRGTINASVYHYSNSNLQIEQITAGGGVQVVNAPKARVFGGELAATFKVTDGLRIDLGAAYVDAKYKQFVTFDNNLGLATGIDLGAIGFPLNNAPKFSGNVGLENKFELGSAASLKVRGEVIYSSSYFVREFDRPFLKIDSYAMVNAFATLSLADDRYSIRVFGRNLTDRTLLASAIGFQGVPLGSFQAPRTFGVEATVHF